MNNKKILCVDDDTALLAALRRQLSKSFEIHTASGGQEALDMLANNGPFALIISDLKMPRMDGIELLAKANEIAPETVRILLTGYADMESAVEAVNEGGIFRFLSKPCSSPTLEKAINDALEQFDLVIARKEIHALQRFKNSMEGVIAGFSSLLETRDPYTAGHQRRVADLSCAIANKLNFSANHVDAIRIAGLLHDIGKVYVPSDFLNRPGRLRDQEFSIIHLHAEIGADILEPVTFDWPVSTYIRQHHERLDGSGYPHGLKGDEISKEACILAVADVIDAMSCHRPYRASLGLSTALSEIKKHKGISFDEQVVHTVFQLFDDHEFKHQFECKMQRPFDVR